MAEPDNLIPAIVGLTVFGEIILLLLGIIVAAVMWNKRRKIQNPAVAPSMNIDQSQQGEEKSNPIYQSEDQPYSLANDINQSALRNPAFDAQQYAIVGGDAAANQSEGAEYSMAGGPISSNQSALRNPAFDSQEYAIVGGADGANQSAGGEYSMAGGPIDSNQSVGAEYSTVGETMEPRQADETEYSIAGGPIGFNKSEGGGDNEKDVVYNVLRRDGH